MAKHRARMRPANMPTQLQGLPAIGKGIRIVMIIIIVLIAILIVVLIANKNIRTIR